MFELLTEMLLASLHPPLPPLMLGIDPDQMVLNCHLSPLLLPLVGSLFMLVDPYKLHRGLEPDLLPEALLLYLDMKQLARKLVQLYH